MKLVKKIFLVIIILITAILLHSIVTDKTFSTYSAYSGSNAVQTYKYSKDLFCIQKGTSWGGTLQLMGTIKIAGKWVRSATINRT